MTIYTRMHDKITYKCPVHGLVQSPAAEHLSGHGCPLCSREANLALMREAGDRAIAERKLGWDEVIKRAKEVHGDRYDYSRVKEDKYINTAAKMKVVCKQHGLFEPTIHDHLFNASGCPKCNASKGEIAVAKFLENNKIKFISQKQFKNCRYKNPLKFDFYLPEYNTCIEYQGEQHYRSVNHFGGEEALKELQTRDQIKRDFCKKEGISLIEIPFNVSVDDKLQILLN